MPNHNIYNAYTLKEILSIERPIINRPTPDTTLDTEEIIAKN